MGKLYVVRHADAGTRGLGDGPDELRALTTRGKRQAEGLRAQLADCGISRLLASPYRRCIDTLQPLGDLLDLKVEPDERLAEGRSPYGVLELVDEIGDAAAALCSHGDVIPDLLEALVAGGMTLKQEPRWPKASTWVLTRDGDRFAEGTYLPPPA